MTSKASIGIVFSPWVAEAGRIAGALGERLRGTAPVWTGPTEELDGGQRDVRGLSLLVTVGGDGTILRAMRAAAPAGVPIVGVNMGRIGFLTEMSAEEAIERIVAYAGGEGWIEERTMLQAQVLGGDGGPPAEGRASVAHALNDAVVGCAGVGRLVFVDVRTDDQPLASYAADAVIVATATGSTGHALSAGGPILYPESTSLLVKPVAPQLATPAAVVLRPGVVVDLAVQSDGEAILTMDGFLDRPLAPGDVVRVCESPHRARFLRAGTPHHLPAALVHRLSSSRRGERGPHQPGTSGGLAGP